MVFEHVKDHTRNKINPFYNQKQVYFTSVVIE